VGSTNLELTNKRHLEPQGLSRDRCQGSGRHQASCRSPLRALFCARRCQWRRPFITKERIFILLHRHHHRHRLRTSDIDIDIDLDSETSPCCVSWTGELHCECWAGARESTLEGERVIREYGLRPDQPTCGCGKIGRPVRWFILCAETSQSHGERLLRAVS
jgi:hypothetical protein